MKVLCNDCEHRQVCKHRFDYEKTLSMISIEVGTPFSLLLECPFHKTDIQSFYTTTALFGDTQSITSTSDAPEAYLSSSKGG